MPNATCRKNDVPNHKPNCKRKNIVLKIDLEPKVIKKPRITRTISCPASATFAELHVAIQMAFAWHDAHLHQFWIIEKRPRSPYPISTLILCDKSVAFSGEDEVKDTSDYRLHQFFDNDKLGPRKVVYEYDLGDCWHHEITCVKREDPTKDFVCLKGEGHPCAEDVGGCGGWLDMLEAYDAKSPTEEQIQRMKWYADCISPEGLGGDIRWRWRKDLVNEGLAMIMDCRKRRDT
ncbi:hypothetical protein FQN54_005183 [Arachnomyces sp. PD_36]|nr:hypothetical protein FQN54_005183 [Arachnomyces sp. PD_36]